MILEIVLWVVVAFLGIEFFLHLWLMFLKRRFDLILTRSDRYPKFNKKALEKFLKGSYDSELGWVRKPNTSKKEVFLDEEKIYHINEKGSRVNPGHETQKTKVITVGDSYAFCREVNDNETWQYFLAEKRKHNVSNYGVGNYGMDQALLRFKRELKHRKESLQYAVMAVVPETIQRNLACWKHYSEYGNTFAFKPRFILKKGKLHLIENPAKNPQNFYHIKRILPLVNKYDHFYEDFEREVLHFPYTFSMVRKRKLKQVLSFSVARVFELFHINWRKLPFIPAQKIKQEITSTIERKDKLFHSKETRALSLALLKEFSTLAKKRNLKPVFMMMPQEDDARDLIEKKRAYYQDFLDEASKFIAVVDLVTPFLTLKDPLRIFSQKRYSKDFVVINGHYNAFGNKMVAEELNKVLKKL